MQLNRCRGPNRHTYSFTPTERMIVNSAAFKERKHSSWQVVDQEPRHHSNQTLRLISTRWGSVTERERGGEGGLKTDSGSSYEVKSWHEGSEAFLRGGVRAGRDGGHGAPPEVSLGEHHLDSHTCRSLVSCQIVQEKWSRWL